MISVIIFRIEHYLVVTVRQIIEVWKCEIGGRVFVHHDIALLQRNGRPVFFLGLTMEGNPWELFVNQIRVTDHNIRLLLYFIHIMFGRLQTEKLVSDRATLRFPCRVGQRNPILIVRLIHVYFTRQSTRQQQVTTADIDHGAAAVSLAVNVGDINSDLVAVKRCVATQRHVLLSGEGDLENTIIIGSQVAVGHCARFNGGMPPITTPPRERTVTGHAVAHRSTVKRVTRQGHRTALHRHFLSNREGLLRSFNLHLESRQLIFFHRNSMAERLVAHVSVNMICPCQTALGQHKLTRNGTELIGSQFYLLHLLKVHVFQRDLYESIGQQTGIFILIYKFKNPFEMDRLRGTVERPVSKKVAVNAVFRIPTIVLPPIESPVRQGLPVPRDRKAVCATVFAIPQTPKLTEAVTICSLGKSLFVPIHGHFGVGKRFAGFSVQSQDFQTKLRDSR